ARPLVGHRSHDMSVLRTLEPEGPGGSLQCHQSRLVIELKLVYPHTLPGRLGELHGMGTASHHGAAPPAFGTVRGGHDAREMTRRRVDVARHVGGHVDSVVRA